MHPPTRLRGQRLSIHPEYLNTPRLVADATGTTVWRWDQAEPFGSNPANEDPDANSVVFDLPLRLPGQRYDAETALHYNYFRDYDPTLGIYKQSDPIGLRGGLNTYMYAAVTPLVQMDVFGLFTPGIHQEITRDAISDIGRSCTFLFLALPGTVAGVDTLPGSQAMNQSHWHAMRGTGESVQSARNRYQNHVDEQMRQCSIAGLAMALHAVQDSVSHSGFPEYGGDIGGIPLVSPSHAYNDRMPSDYSRNEAKMRSRWVISNVLDKCPCICR